MGEMDPTQDWHSMSPEDRAKNMHLYRKKTPAELAAERERGLAELEERSFRFRRKAWLWLTALCIGLVAVAPGAATWVGAIVLACLFVVAFITLVGWWVRPPGTRR